MQSSIFNLIIDLANDKIEIIKENTDSKSFADREEIIIVLYRNPNFWKESLIPLCNLLNDSKLDKYIDIYNSRINEGLENFNLYTHLLLFKWQKIDRREIYKLYTGSRLFIKLRGELTFNKNINKAKLVYFIANLLDLYGIIDFENWGTFVRLFRENENKLDSEERFFEIGDYSSGDLKAVNIDNIYYKRGYFNTLVKLHLPEELIMYGDENKKILIDSIVGNLIVESPKTPIQVLPKLEDLLRVKTFEDLVISDHEIIKPTRTNKINTINNFKFIRSIGDISKLQKKLGDLVVKNDILAEVKFRKKISQYDLCSIFKIPASSILLEGAFQVLDGEYVEVGTSIYKRLSFGPNTELKSNDAGIVSFANISNGIVNIYGTESTMMIESAMNGRLVGLESNNKILIEAEAYNFKVLFQNFNESEIYEGETIYLESPDQIESSKISNKWIIIGFPISDNIEEIISKVCQLNPKGLIISQIPLNALMIILRYNVNVVSVMGFGKQSFGMRLNLLLMKTSFLNLSNKNLYLT